VKSFKRRYGGQFNAFEKLSEEFKSHLIGMKIGKELVVVGFTYDIVKKILEKDEFIGRPDNFFLRLRTMGSR
jgi:hypothetical protein